MKKSPNKRNYSLSDNELIATSKQKSALIKRDAIEFLEFGITVVAVDGFDADVENFSDMPTDNLAVAYQMEATEIKNEKGEEVRVAIRNVMGRVQLRFGLNSTIYKKFGTEKLAQLSDADLYILGKTVAFIGEEYLTELSENGLTQAILNELENICSAFEKMLINQKVVMGNRTILQENRILAGNKIYKKLLSYLSIGLTIWETKSEARYNDYTLD